MEGALVPPALGWVVVFGVFYGKREAKKTAGGWRERNTRGRGGEKRNNRTKRRKGWASLQGKKQRKAREEREASGEREMNNGVQKMHPK